MNKLNVTVVNDANAVLVAESEAVKVTDNNLTTTRSAKTSSVIDVPATSRSIVVQGNTLSRPNNATEGFVTSEASSGNTIGPNVERNN